ncbi:MAG: lytic transglycosylase domain-containing protein, partial [Calditrichaeota bacterium]
MRKLFKGLLYGAGVVTVLGLMHHHLAMQEELVKKTAELESQTRALKSFVKVDQLRTRNINRVLSVIDTFNPTMRDDLKHAIAREILDASLKYDNLDIDLICATITHESAFTWDPTVVSPAGALGLMQVMPTTGRFLAKVEGIKWTSPEEVLFDPVYNIRLGSRYLSSLIELYEIDGGLAAYNGGGKRAALWLAKNRAKGVLYEETQNYVPAV